MRLEMKTQTAKNDSQLVSALADGQLRGEEFACAVDYVGASEDARLSWETYHLVGAVLREGESMAVAVDKDFMARLRLSLSQEPPLKFARGSVETASMPNAVEVSTGPLAARQQSANDSWFRWKVVAGVASLSTVFLIAWHAIGGAGSQAPQLAVTNASPANVATAFDASNRSLPALSAEAPQVMIRDPQLDAMLAAHRQFGGTSALQMPAGFLRNATFDGAGR
jgi:sigma-E factor negative regulatory protein RseA